MTKLIADKTNPEDTLQFIKTYLIEEGDLPIFNSSVNRINIVTTDPESDTMLGRLGYEGCQPQHQIITPGKLPLLQSQRCKNWLVITGHYGFGV